MHTRAGGGGYEAAVDISVNIAEDVSGGRGIGESLGESSGESACVALHREDRSEITGKYDCEFVSPPSDNFETSCPVCLQIPERAMRH